MDLQALQPIISATEQAARLTQRVQAQFLQQHNKSREPVTIGDYGAQAIICAAIQRHFPDHGVLAEENGQEFLRVVSPQQRATVCQLVADMRGESVGEGDMVRWLNHGRDLPAEVPTWIIDPIDGTKGFIANRRYAIAIGLRDQGRITAGVMACPRFPMPSDTAMLFAAANGVAYERPLHGGAFTQIRVATRQDGSALRIAGSVDETNIDTDVLQHVYTALNAHERPITRSDGMGKYAMVARGDIDLYMRVPDDHLRRAKVWDHAAGVAILEAAGGVVTDKDGQPLDFNESPILESTTFVIVTNGYIHERVIAALQTYSHLA